MRTSLTHLIACGVLQQNDSTGPARSTPYGRVEIGRDVTATHQLSAQDRNVTRRARRTAILEPGVLRAVDLHQFAQAIASPPRLTRRGQTMPTVLPQPVSDHPTAQGLAGHRTTVMLCQLLRRQGRAEVGIPLAHDRQRQSANISGEPMIAGFASVLGKQARGTVLLEATQQTKHLTPLQPDQRVTDAQMTRLNPQ
jgi:hypothetical protein